MIEIVTHCLSVKFKSYTHYLNYQMSSVLLNKKDVDVRMCVCTWMNDHYTLNFIDWFRVHTDLKIRVLLLSKNKMSCRAIGRNLASQNTKADVVWFADADYLFRENSLAELSNLDWGDSDVLFPKMVLVSGGELHPPKDEEPIGNYVDYAGRIKQPEVVDIDPEDFSPETYYRAIGGAQIVRGDWIREHGYLKDHECQQGYDEWFGWTSDDVWFRKGFISSPANINGIYRILHKERGCLVKEN